MNVNLDLPKESKDDDLLSRLSQATEHRFEPSGPDTAPGEPLHTDFSNIDPDDFTKPPVDPLPEPEKKPEEKKPFSFYRHEAAVLVEAMDGYAKHFLPDIYRKKLFNPDEYEEARKLIEKYWNVSGVDKDSFTPREKSLSEKMQRLDEMIRSIPTPPESREVIIQPLAEILQQQEATVSPMTRLLIAVVMIYGPKLLPAIF